LSDELCNLSISDLARLYRSGEVSPVEVIRAHLQRCERLNPVLNACLILLSDSAMEAARAMEALFRAGVDLGPLQGVPVSVKDIVRVRGTRMTAGSRVLLQEAEDQEDAVVVRRLRAAGAIVIGKTNLHEFATGDPDPAGPFGLVQNPRRMGYQPGSSSSGAGAAVAAGLGVVALGTDTGGSVRIPASLCGVAGLKPTTGRIPLDGIIPLSSTLDTVGPLARRVSEVAMAFAGCGGGGLKEEAGDLSEASLLNELDQTVRGWRVGVARGEFFSKVQPIVAVTFENTLQLLGDLGCHLIDFDPPEVESMVELTVLITQAEGAAYHERYRDREHLYGPSFRDRIFPGRHVSASAYLAARREQLQFQEEWLKLGRRFDVVVMPAGPAVAPPHGTSTIEIGGEPFAVRSLLSRFTRPFSLLGWPAMSIPNGMGIDGLPTGIQIAGPPDSEERLLTIGYQIERALGLVDRLGIEPCLSPPAPQK